MSMEPAEWFVRMVRGFQQGETTEEAVRVALQARTDQLAAQAAAAFSGEPTLEESQLEERLSALMAQITHDASTRLFDAVVRGDPVGIDRAKEECGAVVSKLVELSAAYSEGRMLDAQRLLGEAGRLVGWGS